MGVFFFLWLFARVALLVGKCPLFLYLHFLGACWRVSFVLWLFCCSCVLVGEHP